MPEKVIEWPFVYNFCKRRGVLIVGEEKFEFCNYWLGIKEKHLCCKQKCYVWAGRYTDKPMIDPLEMRNKTKTVDWFFVWMNCKYCEEMYSSGHEYHFCRHKNRQSESENPLCYNENKCPLWKEQGDAVEV